MTIRPIFNSRLSILTMIGRQLFALLLLASLATVSTPCHAMAASPLVLGSQARYTAEGHLEILVDKTGTFKFTEILAPVNGANFKPVHGSVNQGYTDAAVWVRLCLIRRAGFPEDSFLRLWPPHLDTVDVYVQTGADPADPAAYHPYRLGDHAPVTLRPIVDADLVIPLSLKANTPCFLYMRIKTTSTLNLMATVHTESDFITHGSIHAAQHGGYLTVAIVVALINLILFLRLHDRLYLYFCLYVLSLFTMNFPVSGMMTLFWPSVVHLLSDYLVGGGVGLSMIFFALFARRLFSHVLSRWLQLFFSLVTISGALALIAIPFGFFNHVAPTIFLLSLAMVCILTMLSFRDVRQGVEGGGLYLAAFGLSNIGYSLQFLRILGIIPVAWWNMQSLQIASLFNMVLMTLALTERVRHAENLALQAALASEQTAVVLANEMTVDLRNKQQQLEEALENERESLKQKDRFVAMINHEYRTPLAIIQTNISLLEMKTAQHDLQLTPIVNKIRKGLDRLVEVLEASVSLENQSGSARWRHKQSIYLGPFLKGIVSETENLWPGRKLKTAIPDLRGITLTGDMILLKTAVLNLLDNAFKYSPQDKAVSLEVRLGEQTAFLTITDLGCGIAADQVELVFEKGYRAPNATDNSGKGVGLYLAQSIIEQYGGTIAIASELHAGTAVTLSLPFIMERKADE